MKRASELKQRFYSCNTPSAAKDGDAISMKAFIFLRLMRITSWFQWRRKEYLVGWLSFSSCSERYRAQSARTNFFKPRPLISEKLALGCPLFSKTKQKAQQETTIVTILRVKFKDKEYAAHKMASTDRCHGESGIPELLYPHTKFPSECCTPVHDSLVDPVRGYNIRVVD